MKNKKILRILKEIVADSEISLKENTDERGQGTATSLFLNGRVSLSNAILGRFMQEIKTEKKYRK